MTRHKVSTWGGSRCIRVELEAREAGMQIGDYVYVSTEKRGDKIVIVIEKEDDEK